MQILPVEPELFHADGRTDMHDEAFSLFTVLCERAQELNKKLHT
jgi:hypothetical protein